MSSLWIPCRKGRRRAGVFRDCSFEKYAADIRHSQLNEKTVLLATSMRIRTKVPINISGGNDDKNPILYLNQFCGRWFRWPDTFFTMMTFQLQYSLSITLSSIPLHHKSRSCSPYRSVKPLQMVFHYGFVSELSIWTACSIGTWWMNWSEAETKQRLLSEPTCSAFPIHSRVLKKENSPPGSSYANRKTRTPWVTSSWFPVIRV